MFGTILISVCTAMHLYLFWRLSSVPLINGYVGRKMLFMTGFILWIILIMGRIIGHEGTSFPAFLLEYAGMLWLALLFIIFFPLLLIDIITLFGFLFPKWSSSLRGFAMLIGVLFSVIALIQGYRSPAIDKFEVALPGLPEPLDGTVLIAMSDIHLGSQIDEQWLSERVAQVNKEKPDMVILLGDIFEGHETPTEDLINIFKKFSAPMGLWAVSGNHESKEISSLLSKTGFKFLHNRWAEICKGLVLSGVDDPGMHHSRNRNSTDAITTALNNRPAGATIFLSHAPWNAESAAKAGAGLMLSGHTHGGQIWPFDLIVQYIFPLLEGRYEVGDMAVIVSRGVGTWGPRMRLWNRGEILYVTLRSTKKQVP
jgi:uncharacterized protein